MNVTFIYYMKGSTGFDEPITIDRGALSTGINQVMVILIGSDGNELTRQMFTLTCKLSTYYH